MDNNEAIHKVIEVISGEAIISGATVQMQLRTVCHSSNGYPVERQQVLLNPAGEFECALGRRR